MCGSHPAQKAEGIKGAGGNLPSALKHRGSQRGKAGAPTVLCASITAQELLWQSQLLPTEGSERKVISEGGKKKKVSGLRVKYHNIRQTGMNLVSQNDKAKGKKVLQQQCTKKPIPLLPLSKGNRGCTEQKNQATRSDCYLATLAPCVGATASLDVSHGHDCKHCS